MTKIQKRKKLIIILVVVLIATLMIGGLIIGLAVHFKNNQQQSKTQSLYTTTKKQRLRVGHWNVLNQGGNNELKNEALAKIILKNEVDVIALTEINATKKNDRNPDLPIKSIVDLMNLYTVDKNANLWSYRVSNNISSKGNETQAERVGFIYNTKVLKPVDNGYVFKNNNSDIMVDQFFKKENKAPKIAYSRPPFGYKFQTLDNKFNFTLVAAHFDSPGTSNKIEKQDYSYSNKNLKINVAQGSKELNEAYNVANVMQFIDQKDGKNDDLIFVGDTNIKFKNEAGAFASLINLGYVSQINEYDQDAKTSLSNAYNKWSQPYDKIFTSTSLRTYGGYKYDLWSATNDNSVIDKNWKQKFIKQKYPNFSTAEINKIIQNWSKQTEYALKATKMISDHTLVYTDIFVDNNDVRLER